MAHQWRRAILWTASGDGSETGDSGADIVHFLNRPYPERPFRVVPVSMRLCCRTCQHCSGGGAVAGWCRLRRLEVHAEVADLVVCHHWTPRSPELPRIGAAVVEEMDHQLELDRALA